MKIALLFIMQNHIYTYNNDIKLQDRGGPIGLQLTGVIAQLFMVWWDRQMDRKMREIGLRYVDDVNTVLSSTTPGLRFHGTELVSNEQTVEEYREVEADERAMHLFQAVANSIHSSVVREIDCPSRHRENFPF